MVVGVNLILLQRPNSHTFHVAGNVLLPLILGAIGGKLFFFNWIENLDGLINPFILILVVSLHEELEDADGLHHFLVDLSQLLHILPELRRPEERESRVSFQQDERDILKDGLLDLELSIASNELQVCSRDFVVEAEELRSAHHLRGVVIKTDLVLLRCGAVVDHKWCFVI